MNAVLKLLPLALLPALAFGGATSSPPPWVYPGQPGILMPVSIVVKNVSIPTTGAPSDLFSVTLPSYITRWRMFGSTTTTAYGSIAICESSAGTMAAMSVQVWDAPGGTGNQMAASNAFGPVGPTGANSIGGIAAMAPTAGQAWSTSNTFYVRMTVAPANAGVLSFYFWVMPIN